MSRTLKRPMFRGGGKVNSEGTGITSGLVDRERHAERNPEGVGYSQSPFKKFVVDPAKTMVSPFVNVGADIGNLGQMFFGGKPTFKYMNPFAEGSGLGTELQTASQFYEPKEGGSDIISGAQASEVEDTTIGKVTDEETTPNESPLDTKKEKIDDLAGTIDEDEGVDEFEKKLQAKADLFKNYLYGPEEKAQTGFRALTEAGLKALEGDISGGIKAGSDTLAEGRKTAVAGKTLALKTLIQEDLEKDPTKQREIEYLMKERGLTGPQAIEAVYGGSKGSDLLKAYSEERFIQDRTTDYSKEEQPKIVRDNATGYALADYIMIENPEVKRVPYSGTKPDFTTVQEKVVYFDPVQRRFMSVKDKKAQFFDTIEEAKKFLGS